MSETANTPAPAAATQTPCCCNATANTQKPVQAQSATPASNPAQGQKASKRQGRKQQPQPQQH